MFKRNAWVLVVVAAMSSSASAQNAGSVIRDAARAIGADSLKTIEFSGSGLDFVMGQGYEQPGPHSRFINKTFTRVIDFEAPATTMTRIRLQGEQPPYGGGIQPVRGEQTQTQTVVVDASTRWDQQLDIWMTPHGFLKAAATRSPTVTAQLRNGKTYQVVSFVGGNDAKVNGYINAANQVERVETWVDSALYGDMPVEFEFALYKDFGGVKFPTSFVQKHAGFPVLQWNVVDVKTNVLANILAPQTLGIATLPGSIVVDGKAVERPSEKLADGVYLIKGQYATMAIEFKDYIVVLEGPHSEAYGLAVIAEAKRLIPNKRIRYVVNTHTHIDHASGLRAFVAEGATVITHERNRAFMEQVLTAPHTLNPDTLARSGKRPRIETVGTKRIMTDGNQVLELHHQAGLTHHGGLLMPYLPKYGIFYGADSYNANQYPANSPTPDPLSPFTLNMIEHMRRLNLDVKRYISVHMPPDDRVITMEEVLRNAGMQGMSTQSP